jgi:hypothetical protein
MSPLQNWLNCPKNSEPVQIINLLVVGKVDKNGILFDFPKQLESYPVCLIGVDEMKVFGLRVAEDIQWANMLKGDLLVCDVEKRPQPGNIAVLQVSRKTGRFALGEIQSLTHDRDMLNVEVANTYPVPEELIDKELVQKLYWMPLALYDDNGDFKDFIAEFDKDDLVPADALPRKFYFATVLKVIRQFS